MSRHPQKSAVAANGAANYERFATRRDVCLLTPRRRYPSDPEISSPCRGEGPPLWRCRGDLRYRSLGLRILYIRGGSLDKNENHSLPSVNYYTCNYIGVPLLESSLVFCLFFEHDLFFRLNITDATERHQKQNFIHNHYYQNTYRTFCNYK